MSIKEKAVELHGRGFNCAQSVLMACEEYTGMDEALAAAIASSFGGGMRCGEACGAVSGALMAIGLCCPVYGDAAAKALNTKITEGFTSEFKSRFNNIRCADLKRDGISCDEFIAAAAELAEKTIKENK